jgi:hypothetical protein
MKRPILVTALAILTAAGGLRAGEEVSRKLPAAPDGLVEIEMLSGSLRLVGWDREEVEMTGALEDPRQEIEFEGGGSHTTIDIMPVEGTYHDDGETVVTVRVPHASRVEVETVSTSIEASDLTGTLTLETVSGDVSVKGNPHEVQIETVSGVISLEDGSGLEEGEFSTVSGEIRVKADFRNRGRFEFETVSGLIDLRVPAGLDADFEVSTFSGTIENEFGQKAERSSSFLPAQELTFSTGSGGARISLESFSGKIRIRTD